nr:RNA-directed DNA polymerase, eukaryota [Tanacetum cinerariifolium]
MASVLVNGSLAAEFQFHCGLKQGDPLAPYLFILVMESLHLSFSRVVDTGIFKGIKIDNSITISHPYYVDDAVFVVVGISNDLVVAAASTLGCSIKKTPFKYLGVTVGGDQQLRYMFPRIYALEENKECSVAFKLQGDVELSLRRQVRGGVEAQQLVQLQDLIGSSVLGFEREWSFLR